MPKYRGFEGEVPTMGDLGFTTYRTYRNGGGSLRTGLVYTQPPPPPPTGTTLPPVTAAPPPQPQPSPLEPPPRIQVPIKQVPDTVSLPPPVPGTGPPDLMQPDTFTDDYDPFSPLSIGPTAGWRRGAGPAGSIAPTGTTVHDLVAQQKPDEKVAFPFPTREKETPVEVAPQGGAWILAALAAAMLLGG